MDYLKEMNVVKAVKRAQAVWVGLPRNQWVGRTDSLAPHPDGPGAAKRNRKHSTAPAIR